MDKTIITSSSIDDNALICDVCDKSFTRKVHFKMHMLVHNGRKDFQCKVCNRNFTT